MLDSSRRRREPRTNETKQNVSILVVLDSSRRRAADYEHAPVNHCFNPCCVGFVAKTRNFVESALLHFPSFNPCCVGFVAKTVWNKFVGVLLMKFQSLLCWIRREDTHSLSLSAPSLGFNPCCVGFVAKTVAMKNNA